MPLAVAVTSSHPRLRRWRLLAGGALLFVTALLHGWPAPQVRVQWADGLPAERRVTIERHLALREHGHEGTSSYLYDVLDPSQANIRALVRTPEVRDTDGIVRGTFELRAPQRFGERRTGLAWRWGLEAWVPVVAGLAVAVLLGGVVAAAVRVLVRRAVTLVIWMSERVPAWWLAGVPAIDARAFGFFRVAFAGMFAAFIWTFWRVSIPIDRQRELAFPAMDWIRPFAAEPTFVAGLHWLLLAALAVFAAGLWSRAVFALVVVTFELWCFVFALGTGAHPLGLLPLALPIMLLVPWGEGIGLARRPPSSRVPYGFAPWVLGLSLGIAFLAAAYSKGTAWALNGTVRYHFMVDADVALVPWGLWIARHPVLAVLVSSVVVVGELVSILAMFWRRPWWRAAMGLMVAGLLAGFSVFHHAIWPAWWVLLLGFVPWEWLNAQEHPVGEVRPVRGLPAVAVAAVGLLVLQQFVVSVKRI